jgi:hypothetical protein
MQHNATYEKATDGKGIRLSSAGMPLTYGENIRMSGLESMLKT